LREGVKAWEESKGILISLERRRDWVRREGLLRLGLGVFPSSVFVTHSSFLIHHHFDMGAMEFDMEGRICVLGALFFFYCIG